MTADLHAWLGTRPAARATLAGRRGDPNDVRLGEALGERPEDFEAAHVVLLGCPQDEGVRRNRGRPGAARAPEEIRRALYRLSVNGIEPLTLFDAGDVPPAASLEETHARLQAVVEALLGARKRVVVLGGGNDISYPDCAALAETAPPVLAFNIDAHFDVRADRPRNSGTPYRQLLEEGHVQPERLCQIGSQPHANSPTYAAWLRHRGVRVETLTEARRQGLSELLAAILAEDSGAASVFWGLDMDVVTAADAPGVSAPNACGMSAAELCTVAAAAGRERRSRILEVSEVNPDFDLDGRTSRLAAVAIHHFLAAATAVAAAG